MDIVVLLGVVGLAAGVWFAAASFLALLAGSVIHQRDAHDRPAVRLPARL